MKKLFTAQTNLTSATYPLVKIIIALLVIVLCFWVTMHLSISVEVLDFAIRLVSVVLVLSCVLCIYISVGELIYVGENRKKDGKKLPSKAFAMEYVLSLVKENDIMEFEIQAQGRVVKMGASADCKAGSSVFFDKKYYIGDHEYETLEMFEKALPHYATDGKLRVITIDGIKAEKWKCPM